MRNRSLLIPACLLVLVLTSAASGAIDYMDVVLIKYDIGGGTYRYFIDFEANKIGAASCTLTTPDDTYTMNYYADIDGWEPEWEFGDDYEDMTIAELTTALATDWTINWDGGTATATIGFPTFTESDWMAMPTITQPSSGASFPENSKVDMAWTWAGDTANVEELEVLAEKEGPFDEEYIAELVATATTWQTPALSAGDWFLEVGYFDDYEGADFTVGVTTGTWVLDDKLLSLTSDAGVDITVVPEPCTLLLLGVGAFLPVLRRFR